MPAIVTPITTISTKIGINSYFNSNYLGNSTDKRVLIMVQIKRYR